MVSACDDNYTAHLAALIESIKANNRKAASIEYIILDGGIKQHNRTLLENQFYQGISKESNKLTFIDCSNLYNEIRVHAHFSRATFFRLDLGKLLPNHERAIYLDCDTIVLADIDELWRTDLEEFAIAAAPDIIMMKFIRTHHLTPPSFGSMTAKQYVHDVIGIKDKAHQYFQAGVLVFDLNKFREIGESINFIGDLVADRYWFLDQDVLNKHFHWRYKELDSAWNCVNTSQEISCDLDPAWKEKSILDFSNPKIIHFAGGEEKPWNNISTPLGNVYWNYRKRTYWHDSIRDEAHHPSRNQAPRSIGNIYLIARYIWRNLPVPVRAHLWHVSRRYISWNLNRRRND